MSTPRSYLGAFRTMDPLRFNGKIIKLQVPTGTPASPAAAVYTVISEGHRNPFRLTLFNGVLLESETGWYTYEEINVIAAGKNYGG